jgi:4-amino-4-deoxy-L-arabinose transferase-like glycosyltransferase
LLGESSKYRKIDWVRGLTWLVGIWLLGAFCDRLWFWFDRSIPAWDQADYLNGAINYWELLQSPRWFDLNWWRNFWLESPKIPPSTYILTVPFLNIFGVSEDSATLVMLFFSALLLLSVYGIGVKLFNVSVALWAAGLCQLLPGLYKYRLQFLLDFPLTAIVAFSFWLLTLWKFSRESGVGSRFATGVGSRESGIGNRESGIGNLLTKLLPTSYFLLPTLFNTWIYAALFGLSLGIALMVKQTSVFFLFFPLLWTLGEILLRRRWMKLLQLIFSLCLSVLVIFPWYRTNWLLMLTSGKRATIDSAIAEGDPALNTLDAWIYYAKVLPELISFPLLLIPIVGLIIYFGKNFLKPIQVARIDRKNYSYDRVRELTQERNTKDYPYNPWIWLAIFLLGGYLLSSANINKDTRYILPLLPVLSLVLATGLLSWKRSWQKYTGWGAIGLALLLMLVNLFPVKEISFLKVFSPNAQHYPYTSQPFPHELVVKEIIKTNPYLRSILGVLPSTPEINQHNFSLWGNIYKSQVSGRQVGVKEKQVEQDSRSLDWFLTKTGEQGSVPEAEANIVKLIEESPDFYIHNNWKLPDNNLLKLYHRRPASVEVKRSNQQQDLITLDRVIVPKKSPPGVSIPVTYHWLGNAQQLKSGLVLLTWENKEFTNSFWLHDRAIGMGRLNFNNVNRDKQYDTLQVAEITSMLPDEKIRSGEYTLKATYLDRHTGKTYPISVPSVSITIDPNAPATPAPELDLVTQFRNVAPNLSKGIKGLDPIFAQTGRINQYDANQDYLEQAAKTLTYRLENSNLGKFFDRSLDWSYAIALSKVLQQDVEGAIQSLQKVIEIDDKNPYNYAYLAFVYLYDWRGKPAQEVIEKALKIDPSIPELQALKGVAALMQGNLIGAWQNIVPVIDRL